MIKTDKSKLVKYLTSDVVSVDVPRDDKSIFYIFDGNSRLHPVVDVPDTFGDIAIKLIDSCHAMSMSVFRLTCTMILL